MEIFSYHLVETSTFNAMKWIYFKPKLSNISGLIHSELMSCMTLGSHLLSKSRILLNKIAFFAQWENEESLEEFLKTNNFGRFLCNGWYVKLDFLRQWGDISGFSIKASNNESYAEDLKVVAVTIARMKLPQVPRFLNWGRPVEKLVRDHPSTTISLASIRFPRTVSTFSIWESQKAMTDMVIGHSNVPKPNRHLDAMKERNRKDFHFEFTTLRFKPISEHGIWKGKNNYTR